MGNTNNPQCWSKTANLNDGIDAGIGSVADSSSPTSVDNWTRGIMASVANYADDTGGGPSAGGSANALTVTTNQALSSGHLTDGLRILLKATADNSSTTVTFAPDGLTAANIKRADGSALAVGSIKNGMYLDLVYNSGASEWRAANIPPTNLTGGIVLLTSGSVSAAATLDIVLTGYTAYRGLKFFLSGFLPVSDGNGLNMRFSTDGGSTYIATGYNYCRQRIIDSSVTPNVNVSGSDVAIGIADVIGGAANEGINAEITLLNQTSGAFWPRVNFNAYGITSSATPEGMLVTGGGSNETAQDVDAVRFLFSSGNISAGNYAVYGLA